MALLLVILALIVLSVLALGLVLASRAGVQTEQADLLDSQTRSFADAVLLTAAEALMDTSTPSRPVVNGALVTLTVLGQPVALSVTAEFGKVDLNSTDAATLTRLLAAAGLGPAEADAQARAILAWRDGAGHLQDSHPFRVLSELQLVPGMSVALYNRLLPAITIYSGRAQIDLAVAPALARQASGMGSLHATSDGRLTAGMSVTGWAFRLTAVFQVSGHLRRLNAVIRLTGNPLAPYLVLE